MSRIRVLGASAVLLAASAGIAAAADIPPYGAPPTTPSYYSPPGGYDWSGPYVGILGGYGWGGTTVSNQGWLGGAFAGVNFQTAPNVLVGIEGDITGTGKTGSSGGTTVTNPWNATVRARIGYTADRVLFYGTGGLAFGRVNASGAISGSASRVGWTAGAGIEALLTQKVTGRVEYRHTNLGTAAMSGGSITYKSNDIMVGLGLQF